MGNGQLGAVLSHVHRLAGVPNVEELGDGQLLDRFLTAHEEGAFAALVRRHGPMVLGVCRRLLPDPHAVEDAFQATFLVLLRRARALDRHPSVGGWLHTVAYHVALKARADAFRRQRRQRPLEDLPCREAPAVEFWSELQTILDEELNRLPENYRAAVVLCYLEGKTNAEAAQLLGCPLGTVKGRLSRARELLRARLGRRGLSLPVGLLASVLAERATAALPGALVTTTTRLASISATGTVAGASPAVLALAQGALKTMFLTKLKIAAALVLAVAVVVCFACFAVSGELASGEWSADGLTTHHSPTHHSPRSDPTHHEARLRLPKNRAVPPEPLSQPVPPQGEQKKVTFAGQVLGPDKKGLAGAEVAVVASSRALLPRGVRALGQARTDPEGQFRLTVECPAAVQPSEIVVLATAKGHGLGWAAAAKPDSVSIQLGPEQVLRGRLIDLQGQPAAGVKLVVSRLGDRAAVQRGPRNYLDLSLPNSHLADGEPQAMLPALSGPAAHRLRLPRRGWEDEPHALLRPAVLVFLDPPGDLPLWPAPATTDAQGGFVLRGLGAGLGVGLRVQDERFALQVLDLPPRGQAEASGGTHVLAPARILEGTITDRETGKPLPRARLRVDSRCATCHESPFGFSAVEAPFRCGASGGADWKGCRGVGDAWAALRLVGAWINEGADVLRALEIQADEQGRFRLPLHQAPGYTLHVVPGPGEPYLSRTQAVPWPARAVVRQQVKVELLRGVPVRGKVVEQPGGKAVADARIDFWAKDIKLPPGVHWPRALRTRPDGTFEALLPPGSWHLLVNAAGGDYVPQKIAVSKLGEVPGGPVVPLPPQQKGAKGEPFFWPDAWTVVEAKAGSKAVEATVPLSRAPLLRGRLVTRDGKPITRARMFAHEATAFEQAVYLDEQGRGQIDQSQLEVWRRRVSLDLLGVLPRPDGARGTVIAREIRDGAFEFPVSNPAATFHLAFLDEQGQLGAVARLEGKQAGGAPVLVRLAPTASAQARFVDTAGKPLANYRPLVWLLLPPGPHPLPQDLKNVLGSGVRAQGALWLGHADPARHGDGPRTDASGQLTLPALVGGATYRVQQSASQAHDFTVRASQTVVLPDLVVIQPDHTAKLPTVPPGK